MSVSAVSPGQRSDSEARQSRRAHQAAREHGRAGKPGRAEDAQEEPGEQCRLAGVAAHLPGEFQEVAVLHPRRTHRFARPAPETAADVGLEGVGARVQPALDNRLHQVQPSPGGIRFIAQPTVGRAGGQAEAAVDAVEEPLLLFLDRPGQGTLSDLHGHLDSRTGRGSKRDLSFASSTPAPPPPPVHPTVAATSRGA